MLYPSMLFYMIEDVTSVIIKSSVTNIGKYAFCGCKNLLTVTFESTTPPTFGSSCLPGIGVVTSIYVPDNSVDAYKAANGWKDYASVIKPMNEKPVEA